MEVLIILALIFFGLILFAIEVFLVPGITIAGIASAASLIYAIYRAFDIFGTTAGFVTIGGSVVGIIGVTLWFMRSRTVDRVSLKQSIDYRPEPLNSLGIKVGDHGITLTRLTLIGNAEINGHRVEVQSVNGFIDERTPIKVTRINETAVYVQKASSIDNV